MSRFCGRKLFAAGSLLMLATVLCSGAVRAQDISWSAAADGVWSNPNNWTPHNVPTINDTVNFDTSSQHNCTVDGADLALSLIIANNYTRTISFAAGGSLTVNGQAISSLKAGRSI